MNIVKKLDQFNESCIYFCDPIKNNIMNDGSFIRILYSNNYVVFNGVYLLIELNNLTIEKYYNKYKCFFNTNIHKEMIDRIYEIEDSILKKINIPNKIAQYKINEQLKNGIIKLYNDFTIKPNTSFILKISGVWETNFNYGLTYKFIKINE